MRRDTLVYSVAGILFGLVVGYMAASFHVVPRPASIEGPVAVAAAPATPATAPAAAAKKLNPDEVAALESLAARQPKDASVRVELGNLYMDAERWDEAIRWYREALAVNPALVETATDLGACLVSAGRPAEGLAEFERVLAADPGSRSGLYNKGIALLQMGRPQEAAAAWEELLKRHPADPQLSGLRGRIDQIRATAGK
jgi:tetratricopeptide (TPR) repeat protein